MLLNNMLIKSGCNHSVGATSFKLDGRAKLSKLYDWFGALLKFSSNPGICIGTQGICKQIIWRFPLLRFLQAHKVSAKSMPYAQIPPSDSPRIFLSGSML